MGDDQRAHRDVEPKDLSPLGSTSSSATHQADTVVIERQIVGENLRGSISSPAIINGRSTT